MSQSLRPFHLAIPTLNINISRDWYVDILGCTIGRYDEYWMDFNFFGHQLVVHLVNKMDEYSRSNSVDGEEIPANHFGVVLSMDHWEKLVLNLKDKDIKFVIEPQLRFKKTNGEQATFFISDPFGNMLEFKAFKEDKFLFSQF